jgi:hypothetical protein
MSSMPFSEEAWDVFVGYRAHQVLEFIDVFNPVASMSTMINGHLHQLENAAMMHSERGAEWKNLMSLKSRDDVKKSRALDSKILTAAKIKVHCRDVTENSEGAIS